MKLIEVDDPGQIVVLPLMDAAGVGRTVTVALPETVWVQPGAAVYATLTRLYVVVEANAPVLRDAVPPAPMLMVVLVPPLILYVTVVLGVPVKLMEVDDPAQIVVLPLIDAVGVGRTVTVAVPVVVVLQLGASV